ncbi:MAG: 1-acyl-sn-glycerol-3-phosphate acyltransferase [Cyanobacteria bacterium P01_C01_bin.72]
MPDAKFIPPQQNPLLVRLIQSFFFLVAYFAFKFRLIVSEADLTKVRAIANQRVVYLPNHSNLDDGMVMFQLSARIGQLFHYIVAVEAFRGAIGNLLQTVGAYSIRRGVGDRSSIVQTIKLLQQPQSKLVIFPEGGCSYQNDTVIPFRTGAVELSFKAMSKIVKQEKIVPDFYLVPVTLKYCYPNATALDVSQAIASLETALGISSEQKDNYYRLRAIAQHLLDSLEAEYHVVPAVETDWNQRLGLLRQQMLHYCEAKLELTSNNQLRDRERVYKVQAFLRNLAESERDPLINYDHLYLTTVRLLNFDAIYDGYVAEKPTPERFFATIDRFEREVFKIDQAKPKGVRQIITTISTPINLKDYWQEYQQQSDSLVERLTTMAQQEVQQNLTQCKCSSNP